MKRTLFVILVLALGAHFIFSWIGYNPTDDGFILAYARRILLGQVPHRDFISIRPVASALLHSVYLPLAGEWLYWISRAVVWAEFATIAVLSVQLIFRAFEIQVSWWVFASASALAFMGNSHTFPMMAWHTVDALFLCVGGLSLILSRKFEALGWLLLGIAPLCKQNFLLWPFAVMGILILQRRFDWRATFAFLIPGILYLGWVGLAGGLSELQLQLFSHTELKQTGWTAYRTSGRVLIGSAIGVLLLLGLLKGNIGKWMRWLSWAAAAYLTYFFVRNLQFKNEFVFETGFTAFFAALPIAVLFLFKSQNPFRGVPLLFLILAWSASISIGYNTPALMAGSLFILSFANPFFVLPRNHRWDTLVLLVAAVVSFYQWKISREGNVYRDTATTKLNIPLGPIFPGGRGIFTSPNSSLPLIDLKNSIEKYAVDHEFTILPDFPGYWAASSHRNPLSMDWPQRVELNQPALVERLKGDLIRLGKLSGVVFVQKHKAFAYRKGKTPMDDGESPLLPFVKTWRKIAETEYFEIYQH